MPLKSYLVASLHIGENTIGDSKRWKSSGP